MSQDYIHGSSATERERLALMNGLINDRCLQVLNLQTESLVLDVGAGTGEPAFRGIVANLWGVLAGARETVLAAGAISAAVYDEALQGLNDFDSVPGASVWYVINYAEGIKPAETRG